MILDTTTLFETGKIDTDAYLANLALRIAQNRTRQKIDRFHFATK